MPTVAKQAKSQYQSRDLSVVDYELFELPGFPYMLRGPKPVEGKPYISIVGAAQSFGTLVRKPFAHSIKTVFGLEVLNLSVGGAAPVLYLNNKLAIRFCNSSLICIVQVLSARSTNNSYFETQNGKNMMRPRGSKLPFIPGSTAFEMMFKNEPAMLSELVVKEIQTNYVKEMSTLLGAIRVPKILLWFSQRKPDELKQNYTSYGAASGKYPQFINRTMMDELIPLADEYVEVVSSRGVPNKLTDRLTGEPTTVILGDERKPKGEDYYYPSPEMHQDAFDALQAALNKLINKLGFLK